ncbi:MAG: hypothetical protein ABT940_06740 [Alphaproteobacteria bacterium]
MLLYIWKAWSWSGNHDCQVSREQIADSFYYLGFLLTLCALAVSMWKMDARSTNAAVEMVARFGIAVVTTGIGMASRLLMVQFAADPQRVETVAKEDVRVSIADLVGEMKSLAKAVKDVQAEVAEAGKDMATKRARMTEADTKRRERFDTRIEQFFEQMTKRQGDILDKFQEKLVNIKLEPQQLHEDLKKLIQGLESDLAVLRMTLKSMAENDDIAAWNKLRAGIIGTGESLAQMGATLPGIVSHMNAFAATPDAFAEAAGKLAPMAEQMDGVIQALAKANGTITGQEKYIKEALDRLGERYRNLEKEANTANAATSELIRTLATFAELLNEKVRSAYGTREGT